MATVESCNHYFDSSERSVKRKLGVEEIDESDPDEGPDESNDSIAVVDVADECSALRSALANQQETIRDLCAELEEERDASSTAANETMSMILRLQREKAELQMEARQFRTYADERMAHDQDELIALEETLSSREHAIRGLSHEVRTFRSRLAGCGVDPEKALAEEPQDEEDPYYYPQLRCYDPSYYEEYEDYHCYGSGEVADEMDGDLDEKEVVGVTKEVVDVGVTKEVVDVDGGDRVCTVDDVHEVEEVRSTTTGEMEEIKKLYVRLQALEADTDSLKDTIVTMRNESTQLELLKAIAQNLTEGAHQSGLDQNLRMEEERPLQSSDSSLSRWFRSFSLRKKKGPLRHSFGQLNSNPGLLLLVTQPRSSHLGPKRCLSRRLG